MGRKRTPITLNRLKKAGDHYFLYLRHPIRKRTVCFAMGKASEVTHSVEALNRIYMNEEMWLNPPQAETPRRIYVQWMGPDGILRDTGRALDEAYAREVAGHTKDAIALFTRLGATFEIQRLTAQVPSESRVRDT